MMNIFKVTPRTLKEVAYRVLQSDLSADFKLRAIAADRALTILNFHRVSDGDGRRGYAAMAPELFDELVFWLKQRFSLVLFRDLETLAPGDKPPLIISFDDGYKDFIEFAVPILEKHGVCVNQNIIPAVAESGRPPMNVVLQNFIATAPAALLREIPLPGLPNGANPDNRTGSCLRASSALKDLPIAAQKAIFADLDRNFSRFDGFRETAVMSLDEIRQIATAHEIGAHSFEHASMAAETDDYLLEDLRRCRDYFMNRLGFEPSIYAFPNGSARLEQPEIVFACGFKHVLLVGEHYSRCSNWLHSRFTMHAESSTEARARALGWLKRPAHGKPAWADRF